MTILLFASLAFNAAILIYFTVLGWGIYKTFKLLRSDVFNQKIDEVVKHIEDTTNEHISQQVAMAVKYAKETTLANCRYNKELLDDIPF